MVACVHGNTTIVSILIDFMNMSDVKGVHPYIDNHGCTPLFIACSHNQVEVLELLLKRRSFVEMLNVPNVVCDLYIVLAILLYSCTVLLYHFIIVLLYYFMTQCPINYT